MKKLLLLTTALITITAKSQTSVYHPFPDSFAIWNYHYSVAMCIGGGNFDEYYSLTITGDTNINSQSFHKLEIPYVQSIILGNCFPWTLNGYKGAIRQDTALKKVFFVPPTSNMEQLLYDFNLQVGDTIQGYLESFANPNDVVISIDSVLVGNDYRKRWLINQYYNIYLIEGIGSTFGFYEASPGNIVDYADISLTCFTQNETTLYPDTISNCQLITSVKNVYPEKNLASVLPNPFIDKLSVSTNSKESSEIIIYDITSRKILQQKFKESITLNTEQLSKGIYIYEVRDKNNLYKKGKVVKE